MRAGANTVQHTLTPPAQAILKHAISDARARGHAQVQPLHVASMLLAHGPSPLRRACLLSHPQSTHPLQCRALELCFNIALDRLPQSPSTTAQPILSNALVAALKRAQAHQRRGCPEQQQPPLLAVKVEIEQLIISILDDPSVSRVMREAGFSSTHVKCNLEDAMGIAPPPEALDPFNVTMGCSGAYFSSPMVQEGIEMKASPFLLGKSAFQSRQSHPSGVEFHESLSFPSRVHPMLGRAPQPTVEPLSSPTIDKVVQQVIEVLLRPAKKSPVLVGDSLANVHAVFKQLQTVIKSGDVAEPLQNIPILTPELSSLSFQSRSRPEMEGKLAELSKIVDDCMPRGCILHVGDLQWFVDPVPQNSMGSTYCAAQHTAIELGHILERHKGNRLWFIGVATSQTYSRCQALYPTLESQWELQHVDVASPVNFGFNARFATSQPLNKDAMLSLSPFSLKGAGNPTPLATVPNEYVDGGEMSLCCADCMKHFESECKQVLEQERALSDAGVSQPCSLSSVDAAESSEGTNAAALPTWLQKHKDMKTEEAKKRLRSKWLDTCRTLHPQRHNPASTSSLNAMLDPSPLRRMNLNLAGSGKPHGPVMSSLSNSPLRPAGCTAPSQPSPTSRLPHWARTACPAPSISPLSSKNSQESGSNRTSTLEILGMRVSQHVPDPPSSRDGSTSVESASEDPEEKSKETVSHESFGAPVGINLALGRLEPSPFARARTSPIQEAQQARASQWQAHRERMQDETGVASPLHGVLRQKSHAVALRPTTPMAKASLSHSPVHTALNSPLKTLVRPFSPNSPLSTSLNSSLNVRPPPVFDQKAADALKHLYKGLLERVSWQGEAIAAIATTVMNARSGLGKLRGVTAKADAWLLFLGQDRVGQRLVANALAELVFGSEKKLIRFGLPGQGRGSSCLGWGQEDQEAGFKQRGRTSLDKLAEAFKYNLLSVFFLEDIDQADHVLRMRLSRAMETGKLVDSSGREVSVNNAIVIMTSSVGAYFGKRVGESPLCEEKVAPLGGIRMKLTLEESFSKKILFKGGPKFRIVEHEGGKTNSGEQLSGKKRNADGPVESADEKRMKVMSPTGRAIALDLNLSAEENESVDEGAEEENCAEAEVLSEPKREDIICAARDALSPKFCSLVDDTMVFEPYDMNRSTNRVLSQLSKACGGVIAEGAGVEMEISVLEHIVSSIWHTVQGEQAFDTWVKEELENSLKSLVTQLNVIGSSVLKFIQVDGGAAEELPRKCGLPLAIEIGSGHC